MRLLALLVTVLVVSVVLAGCVSDDPAPEGSASTKDADTGAVRGRILTSSLDPVQGPSVGLTQGDAVVKEVRGDAEGRYSIDEVPPGEYRLVVSSICCRATATTVEVVADEVTVTDLRMVPFTGDDLEIASTVQHEWSGFISCGISTPAVRAAVCSVPGIVDESLEDPNEDFLLEFPVQKGLKSLVVGMSWESVGGVSAEQFSLSVDDPECHIDDCSYQYDSVDAGSPIIIRVDNGDITESDWKWDAIEDERTIRIRVFAGGDAGVVYQQAFQLYWHEFYWEEAPDGFHPLPDQ